MNRIKYYVYHCTIEERDSGKEHHEPFDSSKDAIKRAKEISNDEFIAVEKHHEVYERWDWQPDYDMGDGWLETIDF